jgi:ADP-ribosylglycohydrolase
MQRETATKETWKNTPIGNPKRIAIDLKFTEQQFSELTMGLIPEEMEDKWFIYYEDSWLYFHRSWTGFGIFKAQLHKELHGYSIKEFWVERNLKVYSNEDDDADIESFTFLIARGLLGIDISRIAPNIKINPEPDAIKSWSQFGGMMLSTHNTGPTDYIKAALFGVAVGDALGVPVEFKTRSAVKKNPVTDMIGYGTFNLPPGTWSDDSSLTFCLAEALTHGFNLQTIGQNFVKWYRDRYWTSNGSVFDVGNATRQAISRLEEGKKPELAGNSGEGDNGNGSLMRILPLLFYLIEKPIEERFEITKKVSSITHGHIRSVIACFYYLEFARQIIKGNDKFEIYQNLRTEIFDYLTLLSIDPLEIAHFDRLLKSDISLLDEQQIQSSGYVLHTLEASIWCLLNTDDFEEAVLRAVNLGNDTDTTGAVTGGLAGLLYGFEDIPEKWLHPLARYQDIENLTLRLKDQFSG